ncbi:WXG100 family type VII secretion target [Microbacterium sp. cx-55]|uniref:WXG100 family type VII secretion target n=1 Tax=Microbacterium sp. cx-55 TaxID=2875948 RepID=UPI001CC0C8C9|nr:WXG100 family type VII secretion target [Microbacterium sp. cx-55]MBZ4486212.1 WXG100 family type VII secretion target [Microbacterium sp. cx-55]UGB33921.1 WXG100 family type VII secretion target [Microbacterium sp. cx-55]
MDRLEVNPAKIAESAASIASAGKAIDDALAQLDEAASVLRSQWSGDAQVAYDAAHARLADLFATRTELLQTVSTALDQLATGYSTVDLEGAHTLGVSG